MGKPPGSTPGGFLSLATRPALRERPDRGRWGFRTPDLRLV